MSPRRLRHTSSIAASTWRNAVFREVGATPERTTIGVHGDRHRPAAAPGQRLHRLHVDRVDVGAFLAVDLDAHEAGVHRGGDVDVLERLVGHHVTPVAGRVADRQQDRHIALAGRGERFGPPRVPVDRVVAVLPQVRRCLVGQPVHVADPTEVGSRALGVREVAAVVAEMLSGDGDGPISNAERGGVLSLGATPDPEV